METATQFTQKAKVGVAGSFINQMMSNNNSIPEVGKGATLLMYSDRYVYEVVEVSKDLKTVKLESLEARIDPEYLKSLNGRGCMGHQNWLLEPTGNFSTVVWRHNAWRSKSKVIVFTKEFVEQAEKKEIYSYAQLLTPEQREQVYGGNPRPQNVVPGITKEKFEYHKKNLLFGVKDYYYDWSF